MMGNLPTSVDLSSDFPPIGNQGQQGSCVAWAVGYALTGFHEHIEHGWTYSSDHLFSPAFVYNHFKKGSCNGGLVVTDALDFLASDGVAPLSLMPYASNDCGAKPSDAATSAAKSYKLHSYKRVALNAIDVKEHLAARTPVVVAMQVDAAFDALGPKDVYRGARYAYDGGHAMVIVGYDDTKQAFKLFNSWGENWGDRGFAWVGYDALVKQARELIVAKAYKAPPSPTPSPIPTPKAAPRATLTAPATMKNILVGNVYYFGVSVAGQLESSSGHNYQLVVRFERGGKPIVSKDPSYQDSKGFLAAATPKAVVPREPFALGGAPSIAIPQGSLKSSLGSVSGETVEVTAYYDLFVDGFHISRSPTAKITFTWN